MKRNEKTSAPVASIAGKWLAKKLPFDYARDENGDVVDTVKYVMISQREWREIKKVLASAASQTADKERRYNPDVPQPWVGKPKPLKVDRQPAPKRRPYDDRGFDPREGGKVGKQRVPKRKARKPASSPFYPSARPPRNSP